MLAYSCLVTCVVRKKIKSVFTLPPWRWKHLMEKEKQPWGVHHLPLGMNNSKYLKEWAERRAAMSFVSSKLSLKYKELILMAVKCQQHNCWLQAGIWLWSLFHSVIAEEFQITLQLGTSLLNLVFYCIHFLLMRHILRFPLSTGAATSQTLIWLQTSEKQQFLLSATCESDVNKLEKKMFCNTTLPLFWGQADGFSAVELTEN